MSTCESLVNRKDGKKLEHPQPCGVAGTLYRVRRSAVIGPMFTGATFVKVTPSVEIRQVLCNVHKKKAIEMGMECIPLAEPHELLPR